MIEYLASLYKTTLESRSGFVLKVFNKQVYFGANKHEKLRILIPKL